LDSKYLHATGLFYFLSTCAGLSVDYLLRSQIALVVSLVYCVALLCSYFDLSSRGSLDNKLFMWLYLGASGYVTCRDMLCFCLRRSTTLSKVISLLCDYYPLSDQRCYRCDTVARFILSSSNVSVYPYFLSSADHLLYTYRNALAASIQAPLHILLVSLDLLRASWLPYFRGYEGSCHRMALTPNG